MKQKTSLIKCVPEQILSVLKPISLVSKWKCAVSVSAALSLFSCGGSHITTVNCRCSEVCSLGDILN